MMFNESKRTALPVGISLKTGSLLCELLKLRLYRFLFKSPLCSPRSAHLSSAVNVMSPFVRMR